MAPKCSSSGELRIGNGIDLRKPGTGSASWGEEIIYLSAPIPMKAEL